MGEGIDRLMSVISLTFSKMQDTAQAHQAMRFRAPVPNATLTRVELVLFTRIALIIFDKNMNHISFAPCHAQNSLECKN